jgi:kynurenine formamidase
MARDTSRFFSVIVGALLSGLVLSADDTNWGKWGKEDQLGTLNYITPEIIVQAASLAKSGKTYSLAIPLTSGQPAAGRRLEHFMIETGQGATSRPRFLDDTLSLPCHGTTHWDGLGHVFGKGKTYNGYKASATVTAAGALKNGIHLAADKIVTRGVLFDLPRYKGTKRLDPGYVISTEDVQGAALRQGLSLRQGDVVLIRTGWLGQFYGQGATQFWTFEWTEDTKRKEPGIGWGVSQWLKANKSAAVAADNLSVAAMPADARAGERIGHPGFPWPIHYELIRNQGMMMGALFQLDELADACAADGTYEFLFIGSPYRLTNATGSPLNPIAIK